jgi:hypothetical protein
MIRDDDVRLAEAPVALPLGAAAAIGQPQARPDDDHDAGPGRGPDDGAGAGESVDAPPAVSPRRATAVAVLSSGAAAWMLAGPFAGLFPKLVALSGVALAGALLVLAHRGGRPALQLLGIPSALVLAAVLVLPTGVGVGRIPDLVVEALRHGGLSSPPVPFDPGWRVLLVLVTTWLALTSGTLAVALDRPRLAVVVSGTVGLVAMLFQPPGGELVGVVVLLVLLIAALAVAYGSDLAREGDVSARFEVRRMARAGGIAAALVAVMIALSQFGFLLPQSEAEQVVPPQRPQVPPPLRDRVLFSAETAQEQVPWRVGVLDVYRDGAWMTPPFDPRLLVGLGPAGGSIERAVGAHVDTPGAVVKPEHTFSVTFTLDDVEGRNVPLPAGAVSVDGGLRGAAYDPRTQTVRVDGRQSAGTRYTVVAAVPPSAEALASAAPPADRADLRPFIDAPRPGATAAQLVSDALAAEDSLFDQLQVVRETFYEKVIAAGRGNPVDVGPDRVEQLLQGTEASPYEIVAAEVLLARWLGVPARVGYGYYGGDLRDGRREIRPKHGAMWLEAYFDGFGWTPLVGRPPRARASVSEHQKNDDPNVRPTDEIAAQVYVPTLTESVSPVFVLVRYWVARILPLVLALVLLLGGYPLACKALRRWRRRRWADRRGPRARIAIAYAEVRDAANDLNIGHPTLTPVEFLDAVEPDAEHRELAWLVTRAMWGDLQRGATDADADAAEETARSFRKRLVGGQPFSVRWLAAVSRVSLRQPFDAQMPNVWWTSRHQDTPAQTSAAERARTWERRLGKWRRRTKLSVNRLRRRLPTRLAVLVPTRLPRPRLRVAIPVVTAALVVASIAVTGGVREVELSASTKTPVPPMPADLQGYAFEPYANASEVFDFYKRTSLVTGGAFYAVRHRGIVVGTIQQSAFKEGPRERPRALLRGVIEQLRMTTDDLIRLSGERVYVRKLPEQTEYLWVASDLSSFQLLIATRDFDEAEAVFSTLLARQRGESVTGLQRPIDTPPIDPRRTTP